jgi:hypothetical protein
MKLQFNEYGNLIRNEEFEKAEEEYWEKVKPMLEDMTVLELRAVKSFLDMSYYVSDIILRKQVEMQCKNKREEGNKITA